MKKNALLSLLIIGSAVGQEPAKEPRFEMADVRVSPTAFGFAQNFGGVLRGGKYVNRDATMLNLIDSAYGVTEDSVSGGPGWISSALFDVVAKVPEGTTHATARLMLKSLLADRFKLVIRSGNQPVPRYVMTVASEKPKLKASDGSGAANCRPKSQPGGNPADPASVPNIVVACTNLTAADIATNLRQMAGGYVTHDVVDSTKLEGSWDFNLEWTPRFALEAKGSDGISLFAAVEKQLGLKLELKNVPVPSLAIESVNRTPTPNLPGVETALAEAPPRFEAAVIKPADPSQPPFQGLLYTGGSQMRAGGTLRFLIALALQIPPNIGNDMVVGVSKSADSNRWDITAKVPASGEGAPNAANGRPLPPPFSVGLQMLHGLLLERFELKTHYENREVTVYALTANAAKNKLTKAADTERTGCAPDANAPKPVVNMGPMISCKNTTMAELAQNLQRMAGAYIDHPIVDATGLAGGWNFLMGWTPRAQLQAAPAANPNSEAGGASAASDPNGISVFEAVEKELGMKLVKQTRSIPVIVVDHVAEKPVE
jgi:uncharacterized protein (TIGR03435 family)